VKELIDMQLFMIASGDICSVEGWWHPEGKVVSNYIYVQHPQGDIKIEEQRYSKVIRKPDGSWRSFEEQIEFIRKMGKPFNPAFFIDHKMVVDRVNIKRFYDPFETFKRFVSTFPSEFDRVNEFLKILGVKAGELEDIGMVGSYQLGIRKKNSDIDILFKFDLSKNMQIFQRILRFSSNHKMKVYDRGKWTPLRFRFKDRIFCCHFAYKYHHEIPNFFSTEYETSETINCTVEVLDNTHSIYTPTIFIAKDIYKKDIFPVVIYHGGNKGEFCNGDIINVTGRFINNKFGKFLYTISIRKIDVNHERCVNR